MTEQMRSRFFRGGSSSTTSSSESEDEAPVEQIPRSRVFKPQRKISEEDVKRVVRSEKDKRFNEMHAAIKIIQNAMKINDFGRMLDGFDSLTKTYAKSSKVVAASGTPSFFIVALAQLQDNLDECWERNGGSFRRSLDKNASKNLNILKQKLRKYKKDFEDQINAYKNDPSIFVEDEDEPKSDDEFEMDEKFPGSEESSSTSDDAETISSDEEIEEDDTIDIDFDATNPDEMWKLFLKDEKPVQDEGKIIQVKKRKQRVQQRISKIEDFVDDENWMDTKRGEGVYLGKAKIVFKNNEISNEQILFKISKFTSTRGRKGLPANERCLLLDELRRIVCSVGNFPLGIEVKLIISLIKFRLDFQRRITPFEDWLKALELTNELLRLLLEKSNVKLIHSYTDKEDLIGDTETGEFKVMGSFISILELLSREHTKILQETDCISRLYCHRVAVFPKFRELLKESEAYIKKSFDGSFRTSQLIRLCLLRIEHEYAFIRTIGGDEWKDFSEDVEYVILNSNDITEKVRAISMEAYRLANHDFLENAYELLCSALVQDSVRNLDPSIQILFNRAYVQTGLAAFRQGFVSISYTLLSDILVSGRLRELIGQGIPIARIFDKTVEQENLEKSRVLPFHLHINLEMVECVFLCGGVITELAPMLHDSNAKKKSTNKQFFYVVKQFERQPIFGTPDTSREHVLAAINPLREADWKSATDLWFNEKMMFRVWKHLASAKYPLDAIQTKLITFLKTECLKIFLTSQAQFYTTIKLSTLSDMFELPTDASDLNHKGQADCNVKHIVSRLIVKREIPTRLSQNDDYLIMLKNTQSNVLAAALVVTEKLTQLMEIGEKMMSYIGGGSNLTRANAFRSATGNFG